MRHRAYRCVAIVALLFAGAASGSAQQYLFYAPAPTTLSAAQQADKKDGILVQEVQVQKGDTLYGLSRKFSGHGTWYPQILLFNEISDPNKIYTGHVLKIPVTQKEPAAPSAPARKEKQAAAASREDAPAAPQPPRRAAAVKPAPAGAPAIELSISDLKKTDAGRSKKREVKKKSEAAEKKSASMPDRPAASAGGRYESKVVHEPLRSAQSQPASSQKLFEQAVTAYRKDDCRSALELFDRFLNENPASPLAPDASLYKAECYLKLAGQ